MQPIQHLISEFFCCRSGGWRCHSCYYHFFTARTIHAVCIVRIPGEVPERHTPRTVNGVRGSQGLFEAHKGSALVSQRDSTTALKPPFLWQSSRDCRNSWRSSPAYAYSGVASKRVVERSYTSFIPYFFLLSFPRLLRSVWPTDLHKQKALQHLRTSKESRW